MNTVLASLAVFFAFAGAGSLSAQPTTDPLALAQAAWDDEQRAVWRTIEAWNDAFEANDVERYFDYIDPALTC